MWRGIAAWAVAVVVAGALALAPTAYAKGKGGGKSASPRSAPSGKQVHTGPRGGKYTRSASGKKVYIKRK